MSAYQAPQKIYGGISYSELANALRNAATQMAQLSAAPGTYYAVPSGTEIDLVSLTVSGYMRVRGTLVSLSIDVAGGTLDVDGGTVIVG
ncbi:MAG: hypothetical protein ACP5MH_11725 [Thermoproteus sp.]